MHPFSGVVRCFSKQDVKLAQQPKNTTELIALMFAETKQM